MSGNILDGIDQLLNQDVEDITPFFHKTEKPPQLNDILDSYEYDNSYQVEILLQLILGCLFLLVFIVLIISFVLCCKFCVSNSSKIADVVPPAFIYVCPMSNTQTQIDPNQLDPAQLNQIMESIQTNPPAAIYNAPQAIQNQKNNAEYNSNSTYSNNFIEWVQINWPTYIYGSKYFSKKKIISK